MELKEENSEVLKTKLFKTKRIMQGLTWCGIISLGFWLYEWIIKDNGIDSLLSMIALGFGCAVIFLDKKYKKLKVELESRE